MQDRRDPGRRSEEPSEFVDALKKGLLLGGVLLMLLLPSLRTARQPQVPQPPAAVATAPQAAVPNAPAPQSQAARAPAPETQAAAPIPDHPAQPQAPEAAPEAAKPAPGVQLADFRGEDPTPDARHVADWVVHSRDNRKRAFVIVDKKDARAYVFSPDGKLKDSAPVLLGSAQGDDSFPGIGNKPLKAIRPHEKTTPAGRFVAEIGLNANREDVVWVDYDAAVSMHRIRPTSLKERRLERLASLTTDDNRISFGCINLPVSFYENVLSPTVRKLGAVVYVLPETRSPQKVFGSYDVTAALQASARKPDRRADKLQRVALQSTR